MKKIIFVLKNLPFIIHLAFGTKHFGINNRLWSNDQSIFSVPLYRALITLPTRVRMMKKRAFMGFIPFEEAAEIFPGYARKNYSWKETDNDM